MPVFRIYVQKKPEFDVESRAVLRDVLAALRLPLQNLEIYHRYDADNLRREDFLRAIPGIFSEPAVDEVFEALPLEQNQRVFAVESLPGQFDQRADSCEQCIQILLGGERCRVRTANVYVLTDSITDREFERLKAYLINPVESREASFDLPETLEMRVEHPETVETLDGFIGLDADGLALFGARLGLAMDRADLAFCQEYFRDTERRDPTITEIRMIDTYWSDHCRHTTFLTQLQNVRFEDQAAQESYNAYLEARRALGREDVPITLMDLATIGARQLKAAGKLQDLDESEEVNACSIKIKVDVGGKEQKWILQFKNETHNHPTEIEPFGGAATCLGGAIRDPLSGRTYVFAAMRVTGSANPLVPVEDTMAGKLPQRKITVGAANGYSSYGNQIGLATGLVAEVYHPGYMAKRMEIGAVLGAAPAKNIRRERPAPGDVVILLGGKTGRDGCGGATGSSKSHTTASLEQCGAEVQKGNPPEERKIQRLFRDKKVARMVKRCNDFGAGGVSVAIGELADGVVIDLNAVPKKYEGLDGTELAISESQERMAVVVAEHDAGRFLRAASKENLEATVVATVQENPRLQMIWNGKMIVDLSRDFLNSAGAPKYADALVSAPRPPAENLLTDSSEGWTELLSSLNVCSQKGLVERFDSTIGAGTVLMPFGGRHQMTPSQVLAAKIPVLNNQTNTTALMSWGFHPYESERDPHYGAMDAVLTSIAKIIAAGGARARTRLSFQEYFGHMKEDPARWGKPLAALLGAYRAQIELGCASIGGKDSMSGTFENLDVPATLVSFAVTTAPADKILSPAFKAPDHAVLFLKPEKTASGQVDFEQVRAVFDEVESRIQKGEVASAWVIDAGGVAEGIAKMCFGNGYGFRFRRALTAEELFCPQSGAFLLELAVDPTPADDVLGYVTEEQQIVTNRYTLDLEKLVSVWEKKLEPVFPCRIASPPEKPRKLAYSRVQTLSSPVRYVQPRVLIPVFPGTNCEVDTARAFERAGAVPQIFVVRNYSPQALQDSITSFSALLRQAQMLMIPGGFSGGDEPEGSGKFITAFFRNPQVQYELEGLLDAREGLVLGICNGFQALIKLGLLPFGEMMDMTDVSPTLTFNTIARHQSMMVYTRVSSNKSPWLAGSEVGDIHTVPISHGEGRFVAPPELLAGLAQNGQIATQYVDLNGDPTMDIRYNPNGSLYAIEGITSPDGRVYGKMGHSERTGQNLYRNIFGDTDDGIFENGVRYFL